MDVTASRRPWRVAVDRGGTFTDIVATAADGTVVVRKVPTDDAACSGHDAAIAAIRDIVGAPVGDALVTADVVASVRCGTTVATNALLERRGERSALLVTRGFRDLLTIGSGERPDIFALEIVRPAPLPEIVFEIDERVLPGGAVRVPLDEDGVANAGRRIREMGIAAVSVAFLHSYAHPAHELRAGAILRAAGVAHVALSHEVAREVKIVPRASTAAADAYLTPLLRRSLTRFRAAFAPDVDVRFMQSHGGLADVRHAVGPRAVLSGPAGGVLATAEIARAAGVPQAIGFDMGGTSTDVSRWAGALELVYETRAAGVCLQVPALRIETVAAGGGSKLTCNGRRLHVGPESVGAHPGPAGYGRGGAAALTDANAVLGRILPARFPRCFGDDGQRPFDVEASRRALAPLAAAAGLSVIETAAGFVRVAVERMAQAIREISVQRGHDVREHALVCFGGAGAQHACALAASLGMRRVLVHPLGSVLSAWGIGRALSSHEEAVALPRPFDTAGHAVAQAAADELARTGTERLVAEGVATGDVVAQRVAELRYVGVDEALAVDLVDRTSTRAAFDDAHARLFGFARRGAPVELVSVRVRTDERARKATDRGPVHRARPAASAVRSAMADVWFGGAECGVVATPVIELGDVEPGRAVAGPVLLVDDVSTVIVEPGWTVRATDAGVLELDLEAGDVAPPSPAGLACDPVFLSLFANAFMSIAERMGAVLQRVSHSTSVNERLDFSCAVFDGAGRLIANAPHIPVHLGAMGESVRAIAIARGDDLREGDAIATNDPYSGGSHLPDITVVTPVLVRDGRASYFVASRAHHADVGGITPGSMPPLSRTIDDEGVRLHDVLLVRDGSAREDVIRAALAQGSRPARDPDERVADLLAQAAAGAEGARLLRALADRHGDPVVSAYMAHVLRDGEAAMAEMLAAMPDGTRRCSDALDDGTPLVVAVTVDGARVSVDFEGTGARSAGNLNTPRAVSRAAVLYALRVLVRRDVPLNEGCLRPVTLRIPKGSLLDPRAPDAVVGGNVETSMRIVDVVLAALGASAASQGTMNNLAFGRPGGGTYYETIGGGTGAGPTFDGASAVQSHMTNTRITDPEVLERRWGIVLRRFGVRGGSGGVGAHRGGDGIVREIEVLEPLRGGILSERRTSGAFGLAGGGAGAAGRNLLIRDGAIISLPGRAELDLRPGDVLRIETPGGGGYGVRTSSVSGAPSR